MWLKDAEEHQDAMNFFPARNPSAEGIANCDSRGPAASDISAERRPPVRLGEQGSGSVRVSLPRVIETCSVILHFPHRIFRLLPCVSVARSMRGASPKNFGMHSRSTRILSPDCRQAGSVVPDAGTPDSCESPSVRSPHGPSLRNPSGTRSSSETRRRNRCDCWRVVRRRRNRTSCANFPSLLVAI